MNLPPAEVDYVMIVSLNDVMYEDKNFYFEFSEIFDYFTLISNLCE